MLKSGLGGSGGCRYLCVEVSLEGFQSRRNRFRGGEFGGNGVCCFESVAGDADDRGFVGTEAAFSNQLLSDDDRDAACCFREYAFGFRKQLNSGDNLDIGDVFGPASALAYHLNRVRSISRI